MSKWMTTTPRACTTCGEVVPAREFRICHKHHPDYNKLADSWSSECRACRKKRSARARYKQRVIEVKENEKLDAALDKRVKREEEKDLQTALKVAKSEFLREVRVDKQQLRRMDRNENPTKKTEHARQVRLDKIARVEMQYAAQVLDLKGGGRYKPIYAYKV